MTEVSSSGSLSEGRVRVLSLVVACYAAVVATGAVSWQVYQYFGQSPRVKIVGATAAGVEIVTRDNNGIRVRGTYPYTLFNPGGRAATIYESKIAFSTTHGLDREVLVGARSSTESMKLEGGEAKNLYADFDCYLAPMLPEVTPGRAFLAVHFSLKTTAGVVEADSVIHLYPWPTLPSVEPNLRR